MRILVTGGAGFIGSNFIKHMVQKYPEYDINCYDKLTYAGDRNNLCDVEGWYHNFHFIKGDICDYEKLKQTVKALDIDIIINFAAETHVDNSIENSDEFIKTNINGTHNLLKIMHEFTIHKFVQISTDEVYGTLTEDDEPFTEETHIAPNSPYAASKASADMLCRSFYETYHYPISITRCSNNYGLNQHNEKLIPKLIENIREGNKVPIYGDGKNIRDWVHVQDHCEAIDVVLHKGEDGEVYNIGGECEKRNIEIVDDILLNFEQSYDLVEYVEDRKGHDWRYAMDISKIKQKLGWSPRVTFKQGMRELINK
tara:strand:- start:1011 stop:1946 length:936 start_codon:yes stop_codon:yes gene_type:complete